MKDRCWFLFVANYKFKHESETKDILKPLCNGDCVILGRSKAKNQNNPIVLTAMLQSFGTHLKTESGAWRLEGEH